MNQLTNDILAFLFSKRYMDFKTCCGLRLVSGQFNYHATKYFSSLKEFDLSILEKNFDWRSNSLVCLLTRNRDRTLPEPGKSYWNSDQI